MNLRYQSLVVRVGRQGGIDLTDEQLALDMQQGSEAAMEALVHRYHRQVYAYLYRLSGDRAAADDLVQEVFVKLYTRIDTYRYPAPFRAWLYTIAHNVYRDYAKSAYQRRVAAGNIPEVPAEDGPLDLLEHQAERQAVADAVAALPEAHRHTVLLRYYQGLKLEEIAAVTGVPLGTVKSRLNAAIGYLRRQLCGEEGGERHETRRV